MQLLIVEDDDHVARVLQRAASEAGYEAYRVQDGVEAVDLALTTPFDLIFLDLVMPGLHGFEVCRRLRAQRVTAPILIVTGLDSTSDKIQGLDYGADDYLVKPFDIAELQARVRALLRRGRSAASVLRLDDLELDPATRRVLRGGRSVQLSGKEYALLEYLMRHPEQVLTRRMLLHHVWEFDYEGNDNVLDVYISYLRAKIDRGHPRPLIHTVRGAGYRLSAAWTTGPRRSA